MTGRLLCLLVALVLPVCAHAQLPWSIQTPGPQGLRGAVSLPIPTVQNTTFGAATPAGYGAYDVVGLSITAPQTLVSVVPTGGGASTDICLSEDFDGVTPNEIALNASTDTGSTCTSANYGKTAHTLAASYVVTVSGTPTDGGPSTRTVNITVDANEHTVKSHWGFTNNADAGLTGNTCSFQLCNVLRNQATALGDTVMVRNDNKSASGINPMLNPLSIICSNVAGAGTCPGGNIVLSYNLITPDTGSPNFTPVQYAAGTGGNIVIKCETATSGNDSNGNPIRGGGCSLGALTLVGRGIYGSPTDAGDVSFVGYGPIPFDFENVSHLWIHTVNVGENSSTALMAAGSNGSGWASASANSTTCASSACNYVSGTGVITLVLSTSPNLPSPGMQARVVLTGGSGANLSSLRGTWTTLAGTTGSTVVLQGPTGLGSITLTSATITYPSTQLAISGSGNNYDTTTGLLTIALPSTPDITAPQGIVYLAGLTGTGTNLSSLNGPIAVATGSGPTGTTVVLQATPGLGSITVTGGTFGYINASTASGWTENNCQYQSQVPREQAITFLLTGTKQVGGSVTNCHFSGPIFGDLEINPSSTNPGTIASSNVIEGFLQNGIAPSNVYNINVSNNLIFNVASQQGIPYAGDYYIVGTQQYTWVTTPAKQGDIALDPNGNEELDVMNAACAVNGAGAVINFFVSPGEGGNSGTFDCNPAHGLPPPNGSGNWGAQYAPTFSGETADVNVSAAWDYLGPNYSLDLTALTTGTTPNSLQFLNGSTAMGTCFSIPTGVSGNNCANAIATGRSNFIAGGGASTSGTNIFGCGNSAGQAVCTTANPHFAVQAGASGVAAQNQLQFIGDHTDQLIQIINSSPYPATPLPSASGGYPAGTFNNNICIEGNVTPNATVAAARCLFLQDNTNYGMPAPIGTDNIAFALSSDTLQFQNSANASVCCNTVLLDSLSPIWSPSDPTYGGFSKASWWTVAGQSSPLVTQILNAAYLPTATTSGGTFSYNLSSRTGFQTLSPNMSAPIQTANETVLNYTSATPDGTNLYSNTYLPMFPALPSTATNPCPTFCNRAGIIAAFTPVLGVIFNATTNSTTTLTVNSGWVPVVGIPVNDNPASPCIPAGDIVTAVSGSSFPYTATLFATATCGHTGSFGTKTMNPDSTMNGALTPADSNGQACWNAAATVFDHTKTCAAQGLTVAQ